MRWRENRSWTCALPVLAIDLGPTSGSTTGQSKFYGTPEEAPVEGVESLGPGAGGKRQSIGKIQPLLQIAQGTRYLFGGFDDVLGNPTICRSPVNTADGGRRYNRRSTHSASNSTVLATNTRVARASSA